MGKFVCGWVYVCVCGCVWVGVRCTYCVHVACIGGGGGGGGEILVVGEEDNGGSLLAHLYSSGSSTAPAASKPHPSSSSSVVQGSLMLGVSSWSLSQHSSHWLVRFRSIASISLSFPLNLLFCCRVLKLS